MFGRKKKLTTEQLAEMLYYYAKKDSFNYVHNEVHRENSPFKNADTNIFIHERLIIIFWIIDAFFADKKHKLTGGIHKQYFSDLDIINEQERVQEKISFILSRYKEYYDAYSDKAGSEQHFLHATIAKNILQQEKPVMDFLITLQVGIDFMLIIKLLKETIFDQYKQKQ